MLYDKLDDPQAALSFSGKLLEPEDVVKAVAKVLDKPKPVTTVPAWRGGQSGFGWPARLPSVQVAGDAGPVPR